MEDKDKDITLQVDWAESEAWKEEGMSLPTECYSACVYKMEGDDSGKQRLNMLCCKNCKRNNHISAATEIQKLFSESLFYQAQFSALQRGTSK